MKSYMLLGFKKTVFKVGHLYSILYPGRHASLLKQSSKYTLTGLNNF